MKFLEKLNQTIKKNNSRLCIGLDPDKAKTPLTFFEFCKNIIDQTKDLACAYKPNFAFFAAEGLSGLEDLKKTIDYIHKNSDVPVILDAKCGDIGNTAKAYAKAVFDFYRADAVTVNPYMGYDTVKPFADYKDKGVFILCLTSNPSSADFENDIYLKVAQKAVEWSTNNNLGIVVGATKPEQLKEIEKITGDIPILIPGVGAQGGNVKAKPNYIINSSRAIIYSENPRKAAQEIIASLG